jgi:hypothetical protein
VAILAAVAVAVLVVLVVMAQAQMLVALVVLVKHTQYQVLQSDMLVVVVELAILHHLLVALQQVAVEQQEILMDQMVL